MAWLRVDDGMPEHRKVLALPRKDRWTWLELLAYVARQNNGGHVPEGVCDVLKYVTPAFLKACEQHGLLDRDDTGLAVHDWAIYNGQTIEEKAAAYLAANPDAAANDVYRAIGGKREIVLAVVRDIQAGSLAVPERFPSVPIGSQSGSQSGSLSGSQSVHARAHPSPYPKEPLQQHVPRGDAAAEKQLAEAGWTQGQIRADVHGLPRAIAWLEYAENDPACKAPGALAWTKFTGTSAWPEKTRSSIAAGAQGTRSTSAPLPGKPPDPIQPTPPPTEFRALAGFPEPPPFEDAA